MVVFEKPSKPHEIREDGSWACSAIGMKLVKVYTTVGGYKACGHCVHTLTRADGQRVPLSWQEALISHYDEREV